jgi:hypothetical protein
MDKEYVLKEVGLTGLTRWLNDNKKKESGKPFTTGDVQQYADKTGNIPEYMGGNIVEKNEKPKKGVYDSRQTYNLLK